VAAQRGQRPCLMGGYLLGRPPLPGVQPSPLPQHSRHQLR